MSKATGLRKRSQITKANKTMFIWVASMSAVVMISIVISYHLVNTITFNVRVSNERSKTIKNLEQSNSNIEELESQIRALDTNERLDLVKASPEDKALQVVLDALPATANPLSFGASLQTVLLVGPPDLTVKSISVDSTGGGTSDGADVVEEDVAEVVEGEDLSGEESSDTMIITDASLGQIGFNFTVEGPETSLQEVLQRLEKSIRTIYIDSISIQRQGSINEMSVSGHTFYQLEKTAELVKKVVK